MTGVQTCALPILYPLSSKLFSIFEVADLTQKGIDLLDKHKDIMINYTNSMISRLGEEDTKTLVNLLNRLCDIIEDLNEN